MNRTRFAFGVFRVSLSILARSVSSAFTSPLIDFPLNFKCFTFGQWINILTKESPKARVFIYINYLNSYKICYISYSKLSPSFFLFTFALSNVVGDSIFGVDTVVLDESFSVGDTSIVPAVQIMHFIHISCLPYYLRDERPQIFLILLVCFFVQNFFQLSVFLPDHHLFHPDFLHSFQRQRQF